MTIDRVGFVGLGAMGSRMAANLVAGGFDLVGFDLAGTAASATIALMFAGSASEFERLRPVLGAISKRCFHVGTEPGQGQAMELLNNYLSAVALTATSEAVSFGLTQGLDMKGMLEVLNASSGQNTATSDKFPNRIPPELYDAQFRNTLMLKDLTLYGENVEAAGTSSRLGRVVLEIWRRFATTEPGVDFTRIFPFVLDKCSG